jgi:LysR family transcriptional regulator (chromosome initiation inhibitor)
MIPMEGLPLDQVRTLLVAVEEGTFEAAARVLHVTPSAVSQRVKALEQHTGRVLLVRSKPVRPTESGTALVRFARQLAWLEHGVRAELGLADDAAEAERAGDRDRPFQTVAIAVNADSLSTWFLSALVDVGAELSIRFELHREDQDHTDELLRQGLVMAAVASSPKPVQGCSVRPLGRMRYQACAEPAFAERWGLVTSQGAGVSGPDLATALGRAPVVVFNRKDDLQDAFLRDHGLAGSGPRHYVPASEAYLEAVSIGLGWGMVADLQRAVAGPLVEIAPDRPVDVPLYWQQWKLASPALRAVGDAVARVAGRVLSG